MQPAFVVLTDFSAAAEVALSYTTRLAQLVGGRLILLHVYQDLMLEPEAAMATVPLVLASRKQLLADLVKQAQQLPLAAQAKLSVDTLGGAVREMVRQHHPLLLVLGREQDPSLLDRLIRHQAAAMLQATHYPLLLVPEGWTATDLPQRLVVATDEHGFWLTPPSQAAAELVTALQPRTTVVHVAPGDGPDPGAVVGFEAVRRVGAFGPLSNNSLYEVREESPADGILHAAAELRAQLIVLLARPHTFVGELLHHSVTGEVLRRSPVPVLVLPTTA